jgi:hypothetical protein
MTIKIVELYDKAMALSADVEDNFLELGRSLRQLLDGDADLFQQIVDKTNLGRRKAYYLVEVSRIFDPLPVLRARLRRIGWIKLQLIGKHVTPSNLEDLLQLAEATPSKELERQMRGEEPLGNAHCVLMYFSPKDFELLEETLIEHGPTRVPHRRGGLQGKEKALIAALKEAKEAVAKSKSKAVQE